MPKISICLASRMMLVSNKMQKEVRREKKKEKRGYFCRYVIQSWPVSFSC